MMAYTQENIVSSTQENADNNLGPSRESLGAVQFCSTNCAKVSPLPTTQIPKFNVKEKLEKKKLGKKVKKSKNGKKKEKKKKKQKQNALEKCFEGDEAFKETVKGLELLNLRCRELVLIYRSSLTFGRLNGVLSIIVEFLKTSDSECLTKPSKACIVKPFLNDIVYLVHLLYSDLRKFNSDNKDRPNYLNKMSDLLAMVIDVEITTSKIYECKKCKGKSFRTEAKLKEHLEKIHKMETSTKGWKDDNDTSSNIGISEEEREKLVSVLISSLYIYLDNSSNHILDTMLKTTNKNKKKASKICSRIFSHILQSPQTPMSILEYARHILAFKMWKKMLDSITRQREVTQLAARLLPAPPAHFRERVAVLEGIMPPVPVAKPDSAVTEHCLIVKSARHVKYELKDQIQKYLMLINNPQRYSELLKNLRFIGENLNEFNVKDSVFAVDDEDMILYDTFPSESSAKTSGSNKKSADKNAEKKAASKKSADKKNAEKKSADKKNADKKVKSSVTVDCQTDPKIVAELSDKTELVTSSNEEQDQLPLIKIKSEIDLVEVSDAQSNSLDELNVCDAEPVNCEQSTEVNKITDSGIDVDDSCDDLSQKRPDIQILRKLADDKNFDFDDDAEQAKLYELYENLKKKFEPAKLNDPLEVMKMDKTGTPEKKTQIVTPLSHSIESSGMCSPNLKPAFCDETMRSTAQTSSIAENQIDLAKTFDQVGKEMDFQKSAASVQDLLCEPWPLELVGEMEKYMEKNKLADNDLDAGLKTTFKEEAGEFKADIIRESTGMTLKEEEEEKRRLCNLEDDFITELFSEQPGHNGFGSLMDFLNSPVDDLSLINSVTEPPPWSTDGTSQPLLSLLMDDDLAFADASDIAAGLSDRSCEERFFMKDNTPSPRKSMSLEAALSLSPNSNEQFCQKSPEKRALARSNNDNEEPQMKRTRSSTDAHNYLLTPPSTPVASESAKSQVESQKDAAASSSSKANSENSPKCSFSGIVDHKMNVANEDNASPEKIKCSTENRPSSPLKNVKHVVDRPKDSATEKPPISPPECTCDQRLSGSMIDSYFRYFHRTRLSFTNQQKTYIFSVSFYPLLTSDSSQAMKLRKGLAEKRHSLVESITRNVDLFEKDFIIFPIEKHGRWLVVIVCFPGLTGPVEYQQKEQIKKHSSPKKNLFKDETATGTSSAKARRTRLGCNSVEKRNSKETADCDTISNNKSVGNSKSPTKTSESNQGQDDRTSNESQPIKQPCILVFDSSPKPRKTEVVEVIRDYLRVEYKVKHGKDKDFSTFMKDSKPRVPTRKNSACCGVYMLQYADSFFNNPIIDFRLPIKHLQNWFPADAISRKRDEIYRFVPQPTAGDPVCASQMLHVKSCKANDGPTAAGSSQRRPSSDCDTKEAKPITVLDSFRAVAVLEDCNTSDDISDDFKGFDLEQPLDNLLSPDRRAAALTADLLNDDDNAVMDVIGEENEEEEEVVSMLCSRLKAHTPELVVALSRSDYVPQQNKKRRVRTKTVTALTPKTQPPSKRKNVGSENSVAAPKKSTTASRKSDSANKAPKKGKKPRCKATRKSARRLKVVSPTPKSLLKLRSADKEGKDDNSTSIPLRTHHFNELWKTIQKMDKKGRRCRK
ncbi:hypothetical protein LSTR_LSTR002165 [Laodelphax striatellus]|uniref:Ubiquitin-like protease family profile domain-containing protein n=1 Tax=Laodelphax striatellus TaxID=195883 RepID=A0A482XRM3_LAOST|nr:hypothetical protein LSTR_LSTR002165 [Laodelphax striatellus]